MRRLTQLAGARFGWHGTAPDCLLDGWSGAEDGFTWSTGMHSRVRLHLPPAPPHGGVFLELHGAPFTVPGQLETQRLGMVVNGVAVGEVALGQSSVVAFRVPERALTAGGTLVIELRHPDAARPCDLGVSADSRTLGFAVRTLRLMHAPVPPAAAVTVLPRLDGPIPAADRLALEFESLGGDDAFGLLQRQLGVEPLGLLRFAALSLEHLVTGLEDCFARAGDAVSVREVPADGGFREYAICDETYGIELHTHQRTDAGSAAQIRVQHRRRMRTLRHRLAQRLQDADRIFVFQRPGRILPCEALPLLLRVRSFGPAALLTVDQSPDLPSGAVEQLGWGLFHGSLRYGAADPAGWLSVCANTAKLWQTSPRQHQ